MKIFVVAQSINKFHDCYVHKNPLCLRPCATLGNVLVLANTVEHSLYYMYILLTVEHIFG
jgi:hypothetical protein